MRDIGRAITYTAWIARFGDDAVGHFAGVKFRFGRRGTHARRNLAQAADDEARRFDSVHVGEHHGRPGIH